MNVSTSERSNVPTFQRPNAPTSERSNVPTFQRSNDLDLSIIIVNWNTRDLLAECLRSVYDTVHDLAFEVFVVDNASTDGSADMVRQCFPQAQLIENSENVGFARANNQAIERSSGRYIVLLNSDTIVRPQALAALIQFMEGHARAGACGPYLLNADGTLQASCHPLLTAFREFWRLCFLDHLWPLASYRMERWSDDVPREVAVIKGACLVLRRQTLVQVGLLDERYFIYSEEMDLCHRLALSGWRLYWVPAARVVHLGGGSTRQVAPEMYLQLYRSKAQYQHKFWGARGARRFVRLLRLAYLPRWAVASLAGLFNDAARQKARLYGRLLTEPLVT